jgi:hypothetical protein
MMFGITYIPLAYIASSIFKKADTAFKYNVGLMGIYAAIFTGIYAYFGGAFLMHLNYFMSPFFCLFSSFQ